MNKKPISQLPDADELTGQEYVPVVQNGVTKKTRSGNYLGEQGPAGPTGPQGAQGPQGPQGLSDILQAEKDASATVIDSRTTDSDHPQFLMRANGDINIESGEFQPFKGRHLVGAIGFGGDAQIFVEQGNTATSLLMQAPRYGTQLALFPTPNVGTVFPMTNGTITFSSVEAIAELPKTSAGPYGSSATELIWDNVSDNFNRTESPLSLGGRWANPSVGTWASSSSTGVATLTTAQPVVGELIGQIGSGATSFTTVAPHTISAGDVIQMDSERMRVTSTDGNIINVTRGFYLSTAASHTGSTITNAAMRKTIVETGSKTHTLKCTLGYYDQQLDTFRGGTRGTGVIVKYANENNFIFGYLDNDGLNYYFRLLKMINGVISEGWGLNKKIAIPYIPKDTDFKVRIDVTGDLQEEGGLQYIFRFGDNAPAVAFFDNADINDATKAGICFWQRAVDSVGAPNAIWDDFSVQTFAPLTYTNKVNNTITGVTCNVTHVSTSTTQVHYKDSAPRNFIATLDSLGSIGFKLTNQGGQTNYDDVIMTNNQTDGLIKLGFASTYWRNKVGLYFNNMASPVGGKWDSMRGSFIRPSESAGNLQSGARIIIQPSDITTYSNISPTEHFVTSNGDGTAANPHLSVGSLGTGIYYTSSTPSIPQLNFASDRVRRATLNALGLNVNGVEVALDNKSRLKRWHWEFAKAREGLAKINDPNYRYSVDVMWVGDSISEGMTTVEPNAATPSATMVNVFTDNLSRLANPRGRSGRWVPVGKGFSGIDCSYSSNMN